MTVSLGCIHDDVRSELGSWIVVGMIPIFDKKKETRPKLPCCCCKKCLIQTLVFSFSVL
jgi:hypothetical protein